MIFLAEYINRLGVASGQPARHYYTIHEDSINQATKKAERMTRKGYLLSTVKEKQ